MKKRSLCTLLVVIMLLALAGCGQKEAEKSDGGSTEETTEAEDSGDEVLIGLTQSAYPPFAYLDENDEFQGFDVEVMREIDRRLDGYTIDIQTMPWDSQFIAIESGKAQLICNQVAITPEREEKYIFTDSYFSAEPSIIVRKGTTGINSIADLEGKTVWAQVGDSYTVLLEKYNQEHNDAINLHYVENQMLADAFYDLQTGKFDAVVNDPVMATTVIKEKNLDVEIVGEPVDSEAIAIVLNKNDTEIRDKINAVIKEMKEDGTLKKLSEELTGGDYIPE